LAFRIASDGKAAVLGVSSTTQGDAKASTGAAPALRPSAADFSAGCPPTGPLWRPSYFGSKPSASACTAAPASKLARPSAPLAFAAAPSRAPRFAAGESVLDENYCCSSQYQIVEPQGESLKSGIVSPARKLRRELVLAIVNQ
jgi:hypothetical protein